MVVGSDDSDCISICREYEKKDDRFRTVLAEPRGLSDARNKGIELARAEYITFIDGDDYIHKEMLLQLMNGIKEYNCDISIGNYAVKKSGQNCRKRKRPVKDGIYSGSEALKMFLCGHEVQFVVAWGKVYKTSLFLDNLIRYPRGKLHEDNLTTYKLYYHTNNVLYIDRSVYIYVDRETSLSYNTNLKKERVILDEFPELERYLSDRTELRKYIQSYYISNLVNFIIKLSKTDNEAGKKYYLGTVRQLKRENFLLNSKVRMRMKGLCFAVCIAPEFMKTVLMKIR